MGDFRGLREEIKDRASPDLSGGSGYKGLNLKLTTYDTKTYEI